MSSEKPGGKSNTDAQGEIERLKSNMDKAISDLKGEVEDLKSALIELKSSLSELENPFNLLSSLVDKGDLKSIAETDQTKVAGREEAGHEKTVEEAEDEIKEGQAQSDKAPGANYDKSIALIKWVWTLLDLGFDVDDVEGISKYCEFFSLLPSGSSQCISAVASAIEKARTLNLGEDLMALSIYGAAKASGIKIKFDDITDIIFNALRKIVARQP